MFQEDGSSYQVEPNLIAASLGPMSQRVRSVHTSLNQLLDGKITIPNQIDNHTLFVEAMKVAHEMYGDSEAIIICVVDKGTNVFDMQGFLLPLLERGITMKLFTFSEILSLREYDPESKIFKMYILP